MRLLEGGLPFLTGCKLQGCWFALPPARQIGSGETGSLAGPLAEVQDHQNAAFEGSDLDWLVLSGVLV